MTAEPYQFTVRPILRSGCDAGPAKRNVAFGSPDGRHMSRQPLHGSAVPAHQTTQAGLWGLPHPAPTQIIAYHGIVDGSALAGVAGFVSIIASAW